MLKQFPTFNNMKCVVAVCAASLALTAEAQSELYPQHFDLDEVTLLDSPLKDAMEINDALLLEYDADRLMTPFIRQAGLSDDESSEYYGWTEDHESFTNWGDSSWSLEGHVGGHYLTALSLAYASCVDASLKSQLKERLDYCIDILDDCQNAFDDNTEGLKGFIGGQPFNQVWTDMYAGDLTEFYNYGGWVPFYCEHKVLAGLRDAYVYTGNETAKECFKELCDWAINVVSNLSDDEMQNVLGYEHGGMCEVIADGYALFGDETYLEGAKRYCHEYEVEGMQGTTSTYSQTFLDGQHANTQVPKFIGFERIYQLDSSERELRIAAENFWYDVANERTVCIGGNSVSEHFLAASSCSEYISNLDGPESCNSNNMLKLSEELFDRTHKAMYADFYEQTMWNHIRSTQDPETGGYVYFTTLRPQGYRIYSTVNSAMWCCVGTGMENHGKYGHFIYTHDGTETLYVNLFTASTLDDDDFALTQETSYPFSETSTLTINKGGSYDIAIRHPAWAGSEYSITVNGEEQEISVEEGTASYATISRTWSQGDVIVVTLPMSLRYEECPNYTDYIAFKYGPILLAAKTTASSEEEAEETGLEYEELENEYAGDGRMDHAPGSMATMKSLSTAPMLIGERDTVLNRITMLSADDLTFSIECEDQTLTLQPFYEIHHSRYSCYFYQQTEEGYATSDMAIADSIQLALENRTIDFVATGEQQSEVGHEASYSSGSSSGSHDGETYRDAPANGYIQYVLQNPDGLTENLAICCRFTTDDAGRMGYLYVDDQKIANITIPSSHDDADDSGFYNEEYGIPTDLMYDDDGNAKTSITVKLVGSSSTYCPGLYYIRLVSGFEGEIQDLDETGTYTFVATDWITGDAGRVAQSDISYDEDANTITVNASGTNNVCLCLDYANCDYTVSSDDHYLIVSGTNLSTDDGASYLWWLNGVNYGSSVSPYTTLTSETTGETVIVWDMSTTGLDDNNVGDPFSICQGSTVFGLTSTTGTSVISYIGFSDTPDDSGIHTTYTFVATDWLTGDAGRVAQSDISYDEDANTITVNATGTNNVCLSLDYANCDYTVSSDDHYMIVSGTNLSTDDGDSYLWWLNGVNYGSSVSPYTTLTSESTGETVVVWDMNTTGLDDNNVGDIFSICQGSTIFGLTSTTGTSVISYIGFTDTPDDTGISTGINAVSTGKKDGVKTYYNLQGNKLSSPAKGVNIVRESDGETYKVVVK